MKICPENSIRDALRTPVGKDLINLVAYHLGINPKIVNNPLMSLIKLKKLPKLAGKMFPAKTVDDLCNVINYCTEEIITNDETDEKWWKEAVFYQIYPRSFCDSNGDGIGDLQGIISKLDYLKTLGVDVLWLSPIYDSPNDDNGYDIRDYGKIMTEFGTMDDFDIMIDEIHKRGMKLVMDLVVNHTSDEHEWFQKALAGDEKYKNYYIFRKGRNNNTEPPNNWTSCFSGSAWNYYPELDEWALHLFSKKQMDLNWENPELRSEIAEMVCGWLEKGVDGFRMDVINLISKKEGLPDGNEFIGSFMFTGMEHCFWGPHLHEYLSELQKNSFSKYNAFSVGETPGVGVEMSKYLTDSSRGEIDMIFIFDHLEIPGKERWDDYNYKLSALKNQFTKYQQLTGSVWPSLFIENHDNPRFPSKVTKNMTNRTPLTKLLAAFILTMRGTPFIFQGQEIGQINCNFKNIGEMRDVESINRYKEHIEKGKSEDEAWDEIMAGSRDHARTPVQWSSAENAGFTDGTPWIRVNDDYRECNVAAQMPDESSTLNYYRSLIALRKTSKAFVYGDFKPYKTNDDTFCFSRFYDDAQYYIEMNLEDKRVNRPREAAGQLLLPSYGDTTDYLRPYEVNIYKVN